MAQYMSHALSPKQIGNRLRLLRKKSGLKVPQIAKAMKVSRQHIYNWEHGKKKLSVERLQQLGEVFNVAAGKILGRNGNG